MTNRFVWFWVLVFNFFVGVAVFGAESEQKRWLVNGEFLFEKDNGELYVRHKNSSYVLEISESGGNGVLLLKDAKRRVVDSKASFPIGISFVHAGIIGFGYYVTGVYKLDKLELKPNFGVFGIANIKELTVESDFVLRVDKNMNIHVVDPKKFMEGGDDVATRPRRLVSGLRSESNKWLVNGGFLFERVDGKLYVKYKNSSYVLEVSDSGGNGVLLLRDKAKKGAKRRVVDSKASFPINILFVHSGIIEFGYYVTGVYNFDQLEFKPNFGVFGVANIKELSVGSDFVLRVDKNMNIHVVDPKTFLNTDDDAASKLRRLVSRLRGRPVFVESMRILVREVDAALRLRRLVSCLRDLSVVVKYERFLGEILKEVDELSIHGLPSNVPQFVF